MKLSICFRSVILIILIVGFNFATPLQSAYAASLIVNTLSDENDHSCIDGDCSLRDAIEVATSGDTITFSVTGTILLGGTQLVINKNLTITGPGPTNLTVSGNDVSRIFYASFGQTITIMGITMTNGKPDPATGCGGGAIYNDAFLTLDNVIITNSDATLTNPSTCIYPRGGGITVFGNGSLTITNSTISNNKTFSPGGGIYFSSASGTLMLTDVTISGNISTDFYGGGLDVNQANATVRLERVNINNNTAQYNGSGLLIDKNGAGAPSVAQIDIIDSYIYHNDNTSATGNGIMISGAGIVNIQGSTIANNASNSGGGIYINDSNDNTIVNISNSTIAGNSSAGSGKGGGLYVKGSGANDPIVNINNSTVAGNMASSGTGGIYIDPGPSVNMTNTILANNVDSSSSSEDCSGSINSEDYNLIEVLTGCTLTGVTTHNLNLDPKLGSLADHGGNTKTMALFPDSPAVNAGNDATCITPDQRGETRPKGSHCDIGAYEYVTPSLFGGISRWTTSFDLSHGWTVADFVRTVGDVNHDGNADLVGFGSDGVYVALSDGSTFGPISKWTSSFDLSHGWTVKDFVRTLGDVNHDGNADLIGFGLDGVYVALSDGSTFGPISKWTSSFDLSHGWTVADYVRTVGDVNHDGNADLIGFGLDGVYVALSNGVDGFGAISKWTSSFDLSHGWTVADYVRTVGDVNHDNNADLIGFGLDGVYVALSDGSGSFGAISKWTSSFDLSHGWTVKDFVRTVGDVNGDGFADLVGFGQDGVYVATSNGTGFDPISKWTSSFDLSHGWTVADYVRTVGDVNGDGAADLVGFGLDGVYIAIAK